MSLKPIPCWTVICDWHGCDADLLEDSDYSGWGEIDYLSEVVDDSDWLTGRDGKSHYCREHPTTWASDHEQGEPMPARPYLLIHDGDTRNAAKDGTVTLVLHELEDPRQQALSLGGQS